MMIGLARDMLGMSDEDIANVTPEKEQELRNQMENLSKFRLVAEVVKSKYCVVGAKVGQRIVLNGVQVDQEATDCPLCVAAIAPLLRCLNIYLDRCAHGRDIAAPMAGITCDDPGLEVGGLGSISMKVRVEPISQ